MFQIWVGMYSRKDSLLLQFVDCFAFDSAAAIPVLAILLTRSKTKSRERKLPGKKTTNNNRASEIQLRCLCFN